MLLGLLPGGRQSNSTAVVPKCRSDSLRLRRYVCLLKRNGKSRALNAARTDATRGDIFQEVGPHEHNSPRTNLMQVEFVGHAGIHVQAGKTRLLMDAWFSREGGFDAAWYQLPANHHMADRDWSGLSGLIV